MLKNYDSQNMSWVATADNLPRSLRSFSPTPPRHNILTFGRKNMKQQTYPIVSRSVSGRFFVDESCIYCELCVETAPENFSYDSDKGYAYVSKQPTTNEELNLVLESLKYCPIESIGDRDHPKPNFMTQYSGPTIWQKASNWILGR